MKALLESLLKVTRQIPPDLIWAWRRFQIRDWVVEPRLLSYARLSTLFQVTFYVSKHMTEDAFVRNLPSFFRSCSCVRACARALFAYMCSLVCALLLSRLFLHFVSSSLCSLRDCIPWVLHVCSTAPSCVCFRPLPFIGFMYHTHMFMLASAFTRVIEVWRLKLTLE